MGWEQIRKKATYTVTRSALGEMPLRPPVGPTSTLSGMFALQIGLLIQTCSLPVCRQYVLRFCIYLGEIWWYTWYSSRRQLRRDEEKTIKCHSTMDTDYTFLVPGGHIVFMIESPILQIKHQARVIQYSKICMWNQHEDSISSGFRDATIL